MAPIILQGPDCKDESMGTEHTILSAPNNLGFFRMIEQIFSPSETKWTVHREWFALLIFSFGIFAPSLAAAVENHPVEESFTGSVTMGGAGVGVDEENFKFGEYTGIDEKNTGYFVGDADLAYTHGSYFIDFLADDLGLENRTIYFQAGKFGDYKVAAEFDQQPHLLNNTGKSSYQGTGGTILTGGSTAGPFSEFDQETDREATRFSLSKTLGKNSFNFSFKRENKDGTQDLGANFSFLANILPEPVNQTTNEFRASLAHNGDTGQIQLEYFGSFFDNNNESISFNNPFAAGQGLISRDPDNTFQKVSLSGGVYLSKSTRLSGIVEYGVMEQDEDLLAFSVQTPAVALPRTSADAEIETIHVGLNVVGNPLPRLSVGSSYKFYQTINRTPRELFDYVITDGAAQVGNAAALFTQPYDYLQNKLNVFAAYRTPWDTTLKLDYGAEHFNRDFRAVEDTFEQTVKGNIRNNHFEFMDINLHGAYSNRRGSEYDTNKVFIDRHSPGVVITQDTFLDLRRYDIANRERTKLGTNLAFFPGHNVTMGVSYDYLDDGYPNSELGLSESMNHTTAIDLAYADKYETYYLYYSYDDLESQQNGRTTAATPSTNFQVVHDDATHTIGAGANWGFMFNKLRMGFDYSFSKSTSDIGFSGPAAAGASPVDDIKTVLHTLKLTSVYKYDSHFDLGVKYLVEGYQADDFFTDGLNQTNITSLLSLGGANPDYLAHLGLVYLTYHVGGRK